MADLGSVYEFTTNIADAAEPVPLPEREYRGSVRGASIEESKTSGNPMLVLTYTIGADQFPPDYTDGNPDGETLITYNSLKETPRNRWNLKRLCEMHGVAAGRRLVATDFIGQEVILNISHEEYQGAKQARARAVRAV